MFEAIKAIQAQQVYKVHPVNLFETSTNRNNPMIQTSGVNPFSGQSYNPFYPSVENSPTLARSLDLLG